MSEDLVPRRYSEEEVARLLQRAAEMQRGGETRAREPDGMTLAELEEIAREAGIDPAAVRRAAAELDVVGESSLGAALAGAPLKVRVEREIPGEYPHERLDELVPLISEATEGQGNASSVGKTLTWSSRSESNATSQQVLVSVSHGRTLVRVEESLVGLAGGLFGGFLGGVGGGVGMGAGVPLGLALGSTVFAVGFPVAVIGLTYYGVRRWFAAQAESRRRRAARLADQLELQVRRAIDETTLPSRGDAGTLPPGRA